MLKALRSAWFRMDWILPRLARNGDFLRPHTDSWSSTVVCSLPERDCSRSDGVMSSILRCFVNELAGQESSVVFVARF